MRIPIGMWRPAGTRQALGIEGVPFMSAGARPAVFLAGRPAAERTTDAGRIGILLLVKLAIRNNARIVHHRTHARYYDLRSDPQSLHRMTDVRPAAMSRADVSDAPTGATFMMPAEWEPHDATWIAWPHNRHDWPGRFQSET